LVSENAERKADIVGDINVFKRYEYKYLITVRQKEKILDEIFKYMKLDSYGRSAICNIYYDTDDFRLVRNSIEKPLYKEKLRVRSYGKAKENGKVFIELKKKYESVVYKRRLSMSNSAAEKWLASSEYCQTDSQIGDEIEYFRHFYKGLKPQVFLSYEREAYFMKDGSDFRVTFDDNIFARSDRLSLTEDPGGYPLLENDQVMMELKISAGMPIWMASLLAEEKIFKTSFSKYGTYYQEVIYPKLSVIKGGYKYA